MTQDKGPAGNPIRAFLLTPLIAYLFFSVVFAVFASQLSQVSYYLIILFPAAIFSFLIMLVFGGPLFILARKRGRLNPLATVLTACFLGLALMLVLLIRHLMVGDGQLFGQCFTSGGAVQAFCDYGRMALGFFAMALAGAIYGGIFWFLYRPPQGATA